MHRTCSRRPIPRPVAALAVALVLTFGCGSPPKQDAAPVSTSYDDLVSLFREWRTFQAPVLVDGVPDYSPAAMAAQHAALPAWQRRLDAIRPDAWPIAQQADWHVVRAEMNGLEFDHRVLKPWANNPAFYATVFADESDQPAREGPFAAGAVELWALPVPLTGEAAAAVVPALGRHPRTARAGEEEPDGQRPRPLALRARRPPAAERGPGGVRAESACRDGRAPGRRRSSEAGDRRLRRVGGGAGALEDRALGDRRGELHLVPPARPPRSVHLAGRGHADGARAGAGARAAGRRRDTERLVAAAGNRWRPPTSTRAGSRRPSPSTWRSSTPTACSP